MGMGREVVMVVVEGVSEVVAGFWRARKAEVAKAFEGKTNMHVLSSTHSRPRG